MSFSLAALAVVVAAGFAWSGLDLLRKLLVTRLDALPLLVALTLGLLPAFAVWVAVDGRLAFAPGYLWPALASVVLNLWANLTFLAAVRLSPLSLTIPFLSFTPVFAALAGIPLLGEVPGPLPSAGILLVVAGGFVVHVGADATSPSGVWQAFRREKGSALMLLVALLWGATIAFDKMAVERSSEPLHGAVVILGVGCGALGLLAVQGRLSELAQIRRAPALLAVSAAVGSLALALQLVAINLVWVSVVEAVKRGVGNTLAVVFGRAFFAEPVTGAKVVAVVLMAAGVALILS